jgi:hypothetical protein
MRTERTTETAAATSGPLFLFSEIETMTNEDYYGMVRRFGLKQSAVPTVYFNSSMEAFNVPDGSKQTPEQRTETIEYLRRALGIGSR